MLNGQSLGSGAFPVLDSIEDGAMLFLRYLQNSADASGVGLGDAHESVRGREGKCGNAAERLAHHRALRGVQQELMEAVIQSDIFRDVRRLLKGVDNRAQVGD